jgi:ketosteroid isomerase-like protein
VVTIIVNSFADGERFHYRTERTAMRRVMLVACAVAAILSVKPADSQTRNDFAVQVREAERAFAATMSARDFAAFGAFIADEAVFFGGPQPARGKAAVLAAWRGFFDGAAAPFSWEPETVEVLDSGTLALSSGPVRNPQGQQTATFNSIWRREADGRWRVVFDKGAPFCPPGRAQ